MATRIIIFALIAVIVFLNYTTPKIEDHKAFLLEELQTGTALNEEQQNRLWEKVDYSNFFICSFMKNTESSVMISYGFVKQVKLANEKWVAEARTEMLRGSDD